MYGKSKKIKDILKNKKSRITLCSILLLSLVLAVSIAFILGGKSQTGEVGEKTTQSAKEVLEAFHSDDKRIADIYSQLYGVPIEKVAVLKAETDSWDEVNNRLAKERFTIPEDEKYRMSENGYSFSDLYEAERLAVRTGSDARTLIEAKGKEDEGRQWADALRELGLSEKSTSEHLGLTKEQVEDCRKKGINEDEMVQITILMHNLNKSYDEVMKETEGGKNIQRLQKEAGYEGR